MPKKLLYTNKDCVAMQKAMRILAKIVDEIATGCPPKNMRSETANSVRLPPTPRLQLRNTSAGARRRSVLRRVGPNIVVEDLL